jgi:hypothetical protein
VVYGQRALRLEQAIEDVAQVEEPGERGGAPGARGGVALAQPGLAWRRGAKSEKCPLTRLDVRVLTSPNNSISLDIWNRMMQFQH